MSNQKRLSAKSQLSADAEMIHNDVSREDISTMGQYKPLVSLTWSNVQDPKALELRQDSRYRDELMNNTYWRLLDRSISKPLKTDLTSDGQTQVCHTTVGIPKFLIKEEIISDVGNSVMNDLRDIYIKRTFGRGTNTITASTVTDSVVEQLSAKVIDPNGSGLERWKADHQDSSVEQLEKEYKDLTKRGGFSTEDLNRRFFPYASVKQGTLTGNENNVISSQDFNQTITQQDLNVFAKSYHEEIDARVESSKKRDEEKSTWMPEGMKWPESQRTTRMNTFPELHPLIKQSIESLDDGDLDPDLSQLDLLKTLPTIAMRPDPARPLIRKVSSILPSHPARSSGMVSDDRTIDPTSFTLCIVSNKDDTRTPESLIPRYNNQRSPASFAIEGKGKENDDGSSSGEDDMSTYERGGPSSGVA